jgi:hypothetical protein
MRVLGDTCIWRDTRILAKTSIWRNTRELGNACIWRNTRVLGDTCIRRDTGPGELLGPFGDSGVQSEYLYRFWGIVGSIEYSRKGYTFPKGVPEKRPGRLGSKGDNCSQGHTGV